MNLEKEIDSGMRALTEEIDGNFREMNMQIVKSMSSLSNNMQLQPTEKRTIEEIISRGNTAEVKKNKNGILILEVKKQIKCGK